MQSALRSGEVTFELAWAWALQSAEKESGSACESVASSVLPWPSASLSVFASASPWVSSLVLGLASSWVFVLVSASA